MQIRILGFEWIAGSSLSLSEFYSVLVGISAQQQSMLAKMLSDGVDSVPVGSRPDKILCVDRSGPIWRGMFIKLRNARSFMTLVKEPGELRLTAEQLEQNKAIVEVNFFVLNEVTGRGLYQHYHQSTHLDGFCDFCRLAYDSPLIAKRAELEQHFTEGRITKEEFRQGISDLRGTLTYAVMVRKENLPVLVSELEQINSVEVVLAAKQITRAEFRPMAENAMRQTERFVFGRQSSKRRERVKASVMEAVHAFGKERSARIVGMLPGKLLRVLELEENYDVLGELDFDKTAKDLKIDFSNLQSSLAKSAFILRLLELASTPDIKARLEAPSM